MLEELKKEWDDAVANAVYVEGEEAFKKFTVMFRDTKIEVLAKRRAGDVKLDPQHCFIKIMVPATGKVIDNIPSSRLCPTAEKLVKILESLDVVDHDGLIIERVKEFAESQIDNKIVAWKEKLQNTNYDESVKNLFIEYAKTVLTNHITRYRGDVLIDIVAKYHAFITGDLEAFEVKPTTKKLNYTVTDVIYNLICQCLERQKLNAHGDNYIPQNVINQRFWIADNDGKMSTYIRCARSLLRSIYGDCHEKAATFAFVINGIARYYEATTGESVEMRIKCNQARKKHATATKQLKNANVNDSVKISPLLRAPWMPIDEGFSIADVFDGVII